MPPIVVKADSMGRIPTAYANIGIIGETLAKVAPAVEWLPTNIGIVGESFFFTYF